MAYYLGVDIGTTYTAAAVWRDGRYEIAGLGNRAATIPSVVLLRDDESVLTGEAAVRRAATEPSRVAREFKRRIGDPTPIIVGGTPYSADALVAKLLRWVVDQVSELEGGPPAGIAVSHPANWGSYKLDLLHQAIRLADLDDVVTVTEPEAAAIHYASQERVEPGSVIAVYDLGGGTFDAAVLRKTGTAWEILGSPEGIERLGGVDFDAAVYHHVDEAIDHAVDALDPHDPTAQAAVARLRQECVDAKEALSSDSDVSIPVLLLNLQTEVRLTRPEYEQMVRPALADTITAMNRALRSAGVGPEDVTAVLLVGGSSRTPLVGELVSSVLGRPVAVDAHPKHGVALGAAITAARQFAGDEARALAPSPAGTAPSPAGTAASPPATSPPGAAPSPAGAEPAAVALDPQATSVPPLPVATSSTPAGTAASATTRSGDGGPPRHRARSSTTSAGRDRLPPGADDLDRGDGDGGGGPPSRWPMALVGGGLLVLTLIAGGAYVAFGGNDDDPAATAGTDPDTAGATSTAPTAPSTTTSLPPGPFVQIDDVVLEGGQYRVNYRVAGYTPEVDGGPDSLHIHFFLDTTAPDNAGNNGTPPGVWVLTDEPSSYLTDFGPETRGEARQMCSAVATVDHDVHNRGTTTGNCVDLPDRP
jgi:molecular chaperone DnaK